MKHAFDSRESSATSVAHSSVSSLAHLLSTNTADKCIPLSTPLFSRELEHPGSPWLAAEEKSKNN